MSAVTDSVTDRMVVRLLGPPEVSVDGRPVSFDTRKALAILAYLIEADGTVSRDTLIGVLWPEYDQDHARSAFRRTLSALRSGLGSHRVLADRSTVRLLTDSDVEVDVRDFRRELQATLIHGHQAAQVCPSCLPHLERAASLYRGEFLAGLTVRDAPDFEDWMLRRAESIRREHGRGLERLATGRAAEGNLDRAVEVAARWLALDELHEPAHRLLMLLHAWSDDRPGAVARYRDCVRILDRELGVSPLPETTSLYQAIVEGTFPPPPATPRRVEAAPRPGLAQPPPRPTAPSRLPLVGRAEERAVLREGLNNVPPGKVLLISGEAGIGKTRLIEDMADRLATEGRTVLIGRAFRGESDLPYAPLIEALRPITKAVAGAAIPEWALLEVARLFPELRPPNTPIEIEREDEGPGSLTRFLEALSLLVEAAGSGHPMVLAIDDAQWLDHASARFLGWLGRRLHQQPLLLVVALRPEDTSSKHPLKAVFDELTGGGSLIRVELKPLTGGEVAQLTEAAGRDPAQAPEMYRRSEGNPLLLVELLSGGEAPAVAEARRILAWRRADLSQLGRQLLATSAVIGRSFSSGVLREASGRSDEETVEGLEELIAGGMVRELPDGSGFDFSHQLAREAVYEDTSQVRRRLLHRRIGEALVAEGHTRDSQTIAAAAHHFLQAGLGPKAGQLFAQAGALARAVFAHHEAEAHYRSALSAGHDDRAGLHLALGELATLQGEYGRAVASFEAAAAHATADEIGPIEHRIGQVHARLGNREQAVAHYESASLWLTEPTVRSRLLADWAASVGVPADSGQARKLADEALELAEQSGDEAAQARALSAAGRLAVDPAQARRYLQKSLDMAERIGDPAAQVAALNNLASTARRAGDVEEAIRFTGIALSIATKVGDRHQQAALHNNLADVLYASGRSEESMQHLKRAVALFAEVGIEPGVLEPGVWQLTEW